MSEAMVRASGGFSRENLATARAEGKQEGIDETKVGNATLNDVLNGKTFTNSDAVGVEGRMPNNGNYNIQLLERNQTATIPGGFHSGNGRVTVKAPTARKTLTSAQTGVTSLAPYDYADVDASAVYNAGRGVAINSGASEITHCMCDHLAVDEDVQSAITNNTAYTLEAVITAVCSRPRGDGYCDPVIQITNATDVAYRSAQYSDTSVTTNVSIATRVCKIAAGVTSQFKITAQNKGGALSFTVHTKKAV